MPRTCWSYATCCQISVMRGLYGMRIGCRQNAHQGTGAVSAAAMAAGILSGLTGSGNCGTPPTFVAPVVREAEELIGAIGFLSWPTNETSQGAVRSQRILTPGGAWGRLINVLSDGLDPVLLGCGNYREGSLMRIPSESAAR